MFIYFMGDALIVGRGGGGSSSKYELKTEIYEADKLWVVPKAKDQKFSVRLFGGGGGGGYGSSGGGGGFMNNRDLTLSQGSTVQITIGSGGKDYNSNESTIGGTTSFGTYLAANGGGDPMYHCGVNGGSGGGRGYSGGQSGIGYQFGGGGLGGNGGKWGGGGGGGVPVANSQWDNFFNGALSINYQCNPSNGAWYDGGGGGLGGNGAIVNENPSNSDKHWIGVEAEDGTDTTSIISNTYISGKGKAGSTIRTGNGISYCVHAGGGGGGYGGNGGNNGGGGGGYGADGGDGYVHDGGKGYYFESFICGGGGGGYGKGGYGGNANSRGGGGGGAYGPGGDGAPNINVNGTDGVRGGGGGGGIHGGNGGNGIVIIQYYA